MHSSCIRRAFAVHSPCIHRFTRGIRGIYGNLLHVARGNGHVARAALLSYLPRLRLRVTKRNTGLRFVCNPPPPQPTYAHPIANPSSATARPSKCLKLLYSIAQMLHDLQRSMTCNAPSSPQHHKQHLQNYDPQPLHSQPDMISTASTPPPPTNHQFDSLVISPQPTSPPIQTSIPPHLLQNDKPLKGFHTLDPVQRYALGALAVVLLNHHAIDLNGAAFARSHSSTILQALNLPLGKQTALLALQPSTPTRQAVITDCVNLVGDDASRFLSLQAMLALSVATGTYDARSRAFLSAVASHFRIPWPAIAAVELAIAAHLLQKTPPNFSTSQPQISTTQITSTPSVSTPKTVDSLLIERRKKKMRTKKVMKIGGITLAGGVLFGLTGGLIAPALLSALAGLGVAGAAGLAASGTIASTAVVGGLFGAAGAGFTVKKAHNRVSTTLEEFDFEHPNDPRVIQARKKRLEREKRRSEKLVAQRLAEQTSNTPLAIEATPTSGDPSANSDYDPEKELPRLPSESDTDDDLSDSQSLAKKSSRFKKSRRKKEKRKVVSRALESTTEIPSLHVCICVPAWLTSREYGSALDQFEPALKHELPCSQYITLRWESRRLFQMAMAFAQFWASKATVTTVQQTYPHAVAAASTMAGAVAFAIAMPLTVMSCMDYVDNPWSILVSRSNGAGDELADVLVERSYGNRPVTLFGYSIGARVIFKCLESLASRNAHGIVDNVFFMGGAITADPERWKKVRSVVARRMVNAYGSDDWALAFFHRGCGHGMYVAGLRKVDLDVVENLNMAYLGIEGHRELKDCIPRVMRAMGLGTGYITMPPAKLVPKTNRSKRERGKDSLVCEEPSKQRRSSSANPQQPEADSNAVFVESQTGEILNDELEFPNGANLPSAYSSTNTMEYDGMRREDASANSENGKNSDAHRKPKTKSWLSWGSWANYSGPWKSKVSKSSNGIKKRPSSAPEFQHQGEKETEASEEPFNDMNGRPTNLSGSQPESSNSGAADCEDDSKWYEESREIADEQEEMSGEENSSFDWEKQRRIWDEQERQIQERGYADSAVDIEAAGKVILGISIEITGRRLEPFIEQDALLPVAKKEEIYTNCLEDQHGLVVRVYEHEKQSKTVAVNTLRQLERYPKLLGEMEVQFRSRAKKGKLRIVVAVSASEDGEIQCIVEEHFEDGIVGETSELRVPRSELCTPKERMNLETAARKRLAADKEMALVKQSQSGEVKALPAPEGSESESRGEAEASNSFGVENVEQAVAEKEGESDGESERQEKFALSLLPSP